MSFGPKPRKFATMSSTIQRILRQKSWTLSPTRHQALSGTCRTASSKYRFPKSMTYAILLKVARNLMAAALEDPLNQRFMTISESCIPLYSPSVIYHQLMYAEKSRINACTTRDDWGRDEYR